MNSLALYHDSTGLFHLIVAIISLITGTMVLLLKKGTKRHKQVGYLYAISMLMVNITAFMIYRLFGGFGIFHIFAIVSIVSISAGLVPVFFKIPQRGYMYYHYHFMYWSVFGLYAAFVSEMATRIPALRAINMLFFAIGITMFFGYYFVRKKMKDWDDISESYMPNE